MLILYLYIPPHLVHLPGVLTRLIIGNMLHIHQLCTWGDDITSKLEVFFTDFMTEPEAFHPSPNPPQSHRKCKILPAKQWE